MGRKKRKKPAAPPSEGKPPEQRKPERSVEDPLDDWPEQEPEDDRWTLDRPGESIEREDD